MPESRARSNRQNAPIRIRRFIFVWTWKRSDIRSSKIFGNVQSVVYSCAAVFINPPRRLPGCALAGVATYLPLASAFAVPTPGSEYEAGGEKFLKGHFAARPLLGTAIGLHEYDGKITDYSRLALDAEL